MTCTNKGLCQGLSSFLGKAGACALCTKKRATWSDIQGAKVQTLLYHGCETHERGVIFCGCLWDSTAQKLSISAGEKRPVQTFKLHFNLLQSVSAVITLLLLGPHFIQTPFTPKRWTAQILFACLFIENHVMNGR